MAGAGWTGGEGGAPEAAMGGFGGRAWGGAGVAHLALLAVSWICWRARCHATRAPLPGARRLQSDLVIVKETARRCWWYPKWLRLLPCLVSLTVKSLHRVAQQPVHGPQLLGNALGASHVDLVRVELQLQRAPFAPASCYIPVAEDHAIDGLAVLRVAIVDFHCLLQSLDCVSCVSVHLGGAACVAASLHELVDPAPALAGGGC